MDSVSPLNRVQKAELKDLEQQAKEAMAQWEMTVITLPDGFRMVASVERPTADGNVCGKGEMYDLGQNAEGQFRLFRRKTDPWLTYSHGKPEILSDLDLAGFGLNRAQSCEPERIEEEGDFSSLCRSNFIPPS